MENEEIRIEKALRFLRAGYLLDSIIDDRKEHFSYREGYILIQGTDKSLKVNPFEFEELYGEAIFTLSDDNQEEAVDMKKDEEYYSWRQ